MSTKTNNASNLATNSVFSPAVKHSTRTRACFLSHKPLYLWPSSVNTQHKHRHSFTPSFHMPPSFGVSSLCMSVAHRTGWPQGRTLSYVCSRRLWRALLRTSCHSSFVSEPPSPASFGPSSPSRELAQSAGQQRGKTNNNNQKNLQHYVFM